jgi:hypothetical protein
MVRQQQRPRSILNEMCMIVFGASCLADDVMGGDSQLVDLQANLDGSWDERVPLDRTGTVVEVMCLSAPLDRRPRGCTV